jgi:hypothetical protein
MCSSISSAQCYATLHVCGIQPVPETAWKAVVHRAGVLNSKKCISRPVVLCTGIAVG